MSTASLSLPASMGSCQTTGRGAIGSALTAGQPFATHAGWTPQPARRCAALLVLALHVAVIAVLWHPDRRVALKRSSPALAVSLLPANAAQQSPSMKPQPAPMPKLSVIPVTPVQVPEFNPVWVQREPSTVIQATSPTTAVEPAPVRSVEPSPPPGPKPVAAGSLRYRVEPAVEVPRLSRRAGEHGSVVLRVVFDAQGRPRDIQIQRGSGFARLDTQALEAMQAARIVPYLENGHAIEVVAQATLEYGLD